jgi:hypothetical protein
VIVLRKLEEHFCGECGQRKECNGCENSATVVAPIGIWCLECAAKLYGAEEDQELLDSVRAER